MKKKIIVVITRNQKWGISQQKLLEAILFLGREGEHLQKLIQNWIDNLLCDNAWQAGSLGQCLTQPRICMQYSSRKKKKKKKKILTLPIPTLGLLNLWSSWGLNEAFGCCAANTKFSCFCTNDWTYEDLCKSGSVAKVWRYQELHHEKHCISSHITEQFLNAKRGKKKQQFISMG